MPRTMRIVGRHKHIIGATITESVNDDNVRRFTATIRGFQNWRIFEGKTMPDTFKNVIAKVREIRDRIDNDDETVFHEDCTVSS